MARSPVTGRTGLEDWVLGMSDVCHWPVFRHGRGGSATGCEQFGGITFGHAG